MGFLRRRLVPSARRERTENELDTLQEALAMTLYWTHALEPELHRPANTSLVLRETQAAWGEMVRHLHDNPFPEFWHLSTDRQPPQLALYLQRVNAKAMNQTLNMMSAAEQGMFEERWLPYALDVHATSLLPPYLLVLNADRLCDNVSQLLDLILIIMPEAAHTSEAAYDQFFQTSFASFPNIQPVWRHQRGSFAWVSPKGQVCALEPMQTFIGPDGMSYRPFLYQHYFGQQPLPPTKDTTPRRRPSTSLTNLPQLVPGLR